MCQSRQVKEKKKKQMLKGLLVSEVQEKVQVNRWVMADVEPPVVPKTANYLLAQHPPSASLELRYTLSSHKPRAEAALPAQHSASQRQHIKKEHATYKTQ